MSDHARPERVAFDELQLLVATLAEELAAFRQRALSAEQQLRQVTRATSAPAMAEGQVAQERVPQLEAEVAEMRSRLSKASDRTRGMLDRVRFLRQQTAAAESVAGAEDEP